MCDDDDDDNNNDDDNNEFSCSGVYLNLYPVLNIQFVDKIIWFCVNFHSGGCSPVKHVLCYPVKNDIV